ncbi:sensor histidine kinase [Arenibaculum pallidiluteum]|uniref:sensor histidine kinase n=1 Tax=Arenibaculum pallidiluteum TaxID=2812559 RepID=UPI001A962108|nr:sensor histidine kinase [Arenibaculum pallidiluteum]
MDRPVREALEDETQRLRQALQEKEAALRELQHRAKNSLQLVISLLKLQSARIRDAEARQAYDQTLQRIEALAIAYRHLHESNSETEVELGRYLEELATTTCASLAGAAGVETRIQTESMTVGLSLAVPLGLILNEIVTTALRHAYPHDRWIRIDLRRTDAATAELLVADNGRGLPAGFDAEADAAMMLADALAGQIGATLAAGPSGTGGTEVRVTFPA